MANNDIPIKEWMSFFSKLYSKVDSKRTPEQLWIATMAHCSSIGESIRRIHFPDLLYYSAHTFTWLCSFINRCRKEKDTVFSLYENLPGIVSLKYPLKCGHCESKPCCCHPTKMDSLKDKSAHYRKLLKARRGVIKSVEEYSISQWQDTFAEIYGEQIHILSLEAIGFHFLEEAGEAAKAVRALGQLANISAARIAGVNKAFLHQLTTVPGIVENYTQYYKKNVDYSSLAPEVIKWRLVNAKMELIVEISDTFSWFCSILNKLCSISEDCKFSIQTLEQKLRSQYIRKGKPICPTCKKRHCSCIFYPKQVVL